MQVFQYQRNRNHNIDGRLSIALIAKYSSAISDRRLDLGRKLASTEEISTVLTFVVLRQDPSKR
tara:strand:- start:453 stop:644 length:192 start_codon:yes stop_codon:yes gene_type:complete